MTIDRKLLEILVCPISKQPVLLLADDKRAHLNRLISDGSVRSLDGTVVAVELLQALITRNGTSIYPVEDDIPIMLEEKSIPTDQLPDLV